MEAYFSLLLLQSTFRSSLKDMNCLFSKDVYSRPVFNASTSLMRYNILTFCKIFEDQIFMLRRKKKVARQHNTSELFSKAISNSQKVYIALLIM